MTDVIEIRLSGVGIKPGLVRSREIAEVLEAVEDLVIAESLRSDPTLRKEELIVGLYEIADKSIGLRFKASLAAVSIPAFITASTAIADGHFEALSPHSYKPLQTIAGFAKKHGCIAELKVSGSEAPLATISPNTIIPPEARIYGSTEIAAKVLRVGGKVPRAMIEMLDGSIIYCDVPVELAKELGHQLYSTLIFQGTAVWNAMSFELESFTILGFNPYPQRDPSSALIELAELLGPQFRAVTDVPTFVSNLRRGEDLS